MGQEFLDMGRATFTLTSSVDFGKSMAFKKSDVYCVAPIVSGVTGNMWGIHCYIYTERETYRDIDIYIYI